MEFPLMHIKSVRANLKEKEITLTFTVPYGGENIENAEDMARLIGKNTDQLEGRFIPKQPGLPLDGPDQTDDEHEEQPA